nr:response regulator [uncultured Brevundimonas sp.]
MHYSSVLIVDDDPVFRTTLEAFFALHETKTVLHASEGAQAYAALSERQSIDLIVLDLNMPELDGIEFLALMKEHGLHVPLLVISSASEITIKSAVKLANAYGLNFLGAMSKPVDFEELRRVLKITKSAP